MPVNYLITKPVPARAASGKIIPTQQTVPAYAASIIHCEDTRPVPTRVASGILKTNYVKSIAYDKKIGNKKRKNRLLAGFGKNKEPLR